MKFFGLFLLLAGIVSLTLELTGANLIVLNWLNQWGTSTGWVIRVAVTLLGGVIYFIHRHDD